MSASHIAYGSIRMEPVFMVLGQSAATAAGLAIERGTSVQAVDYGALKERLLASGQMLDFVTTAAAGASHGFDKSKLAGVVVDDAGLRRRWLSPRRQRRERRDDRALLAHPALRWNLSRRHRL
jgi:hypothetical protein